jgi:5-methylcytosine-specific restriction endonuclease McrA
VSANPWMKFFPSDWLADAALRVCGPAARGLWMDCLCLMHSAEPYGHLLINGRPVTDTQLATLTGIDPTTVRSLMTELETAGVFSRNRAGVVYSRRMTRDFKKANIAVRNGQRGGNPNIDPGTVPKKERTTWRRSAHGKKVEQVWAECLGHCIHCGVEMTRHDPNLPTAFEIDHKIPLRHGGTNDIGNLVGSCKHCNFQRTSNHEPNPPPNGASNTQKPDSRVQKEKEGGGGASAREAGEYVAGKTGLKVQACIDRAAKWIAAGFDVQADIIPTVDDLVKSAKRPIGSPNYFDGAIRRHHEERLAPLPEALPSNVSYLPRAAGGRQAPSNAMSPAARDLMAAYRDPNFDYGVGR